MSHVMAMDMYDTGGRCIPLYCRIKERAMAISSIQNT